MENPKQSIEYLKQIEAKGDEILCDRQEIVALDIRRNQNREGLRALQKDPSDKAWISLGSTLIKLPKHTAEELLQKDTNRVNVEIGKLQSDLKVKVNELRDLEYLPPAPGLMLKPMSAQEMQAIGQTLGRHAD